jgi:lipopolysaccharide export LptBFGC system permease protein LptF
MTYLPTDTSASVLAGEKPAQTATGSVALSTRPDRSETPKPDLTKKPKSPVPSPAPDHAEAFAAPAAGTARVEPAPGNTDDDVAPEPARLIGVTIWGFALTVVGLVMTCCIAMLALTAPAGGNFTAALLMIPICGLLGLGLVIASLVTISRGNVPYILLGSSTVVLLVLFGVVVATT